MVRIVKRIIPSPIKRKIRNHLANRHKERLFGTLAPLVPAVDPDEKMLDVGCGIGRKTLPLTQYLNERAVLTTATQLRISRSTSS